MKTLSKLLVTATLALIVAAFIPAVKADEGNWATQVTINEPIQIGNIVLSPGSYVFRLTDIWAPGAVSIYSTNTGNYDGIVMGIPVYRTHATEKSTFIFEKGAKGAPEMLEYWYYPDNNYGLQFMTHPGRTAAITGGATHNAG